jgi:hypothetical protein
MPLIFGSYLAGALLTCVVPIALLIAFVTYFYGQFRRQPENAPRMSTHTPTTPTVTNPQAPASPPEVTPGPPPGPTPGPPSSEA